MGTPYGAWAVLGSWGNTMRGAVRNKDSENGAIRLPKILVLTIQALYRRARPAGSPIKNETSWPSRRTLFKCLYLARRRPHQLERGPRPERARPCHDILAPGMMSTRILGRRTAFFSLSLFLTAPHMVSPQDPSTNSCTCRSSGAASRPARRR